MIRACLLSFLLAAFSVAHAQVFSTSFNNKLDEMDSLVDHLRHFERLGIKHTGSEAANQTKDWIIDQYTSYGYSNITIDSFQDGAFTVRNIIVDDTNASTEDYIVVCAHYDTRNGPGTNDNGTGTVALLATAKLLADIPKSLRIKYIHFDAEEPGLIGSQHYVDTYLKNQDNRLYAVLNIDQIGGLAGSTENNKIKCERDENPVPFANNALSAAITDTLVLLVNRYTSLTGVISNAFLSDYIPFEEEGYTITGFYQNAPGSTYNHSPADTLGNMDTSSFKQAARAVAAATGYLSKLDYFLTTRPATSLEIGLFPNPTTGLMSLPESWMNCTLKVLDMNGAEVLHMGHGQTELDLSFLQPGLYLVIAYQNSTIQGVQRIVLLPN